MLILHKPTLFATNSTICFTISIAKPVLPCNRYILDTRQVILYNQINHCQSAPKRISDSHSAHIQQLSTIPCYQAHLALRNASRSIPQYYQSSLGQPKLGVWLCTSAIDRQWQCWGVRLEVRGGGGWGGGKLWSRGLFAGDDKRVGGPDDRWVLLATVMSSSNDETGGDSPTSSEGSDRVAPSPKSMLTSISSSSWDLPSSSDPSRSGVDDRSLSASVSASDSLAEATRLDFFPFLVFLCLCVLLLSSKSWVLKCWVR